MKQIYFITSDGGVWGGLELLRADIKRGLPFRKILQQATGIEKAIGRSVRIMMTSVLGDEDITEWVMRKSGG